VTVIHVVAWSFNETTPDATRVAVNHGLAQGKAIAQARTFALGDNRSTARASGFTHLYVATFDDRDGLAAFQKDPIHAPWGPRLVEAAEQLLVLDLECKPEDAPRAGARGLRHIVAWHFKEGTTQQEERAVIDGLYGQRVVKPARSFAVGANLGLSGRSLGHTHLHVSSFDDFDGLEEFRSDTAIHAPAGKRLQAHAANVTALDVTD
jgi:hypothetical protein